MKLTLKDLRPTLAALMTLGVLAVMVPPWPVYAAAALGEDDGVPPGDTEKRRKRGEYICNGKVLCLKDDSGEDEYSSCEYSNEKVQADSPNEAANKLVDRCERSKGVGWECGTTTLSCE